MMLKLADNLEVPLSAVTQPFGFIGRRGSGKTHNAGVLVEQMLGAGAQVVVIDPVGTWYGLRLAADGKTPSPFPIYVLGGQHADLPIEEDQGEQVARVVLETNASVVLDISYMLESERKRFVTAFLKALFEGAKRKRAPRMVVIEEAQTFCPQRLMPGDQHMYAAVVQLVRLGRNFGLGCMLISQRPQSVNKEVLTQVECLCVGQLAAALDRAAIEAWIVENDLDKKWARELAKLGKGTMMVWSPSWLGRFEKVTFNRKTTFDASSTPEFGQAIEVVELPKLDLAALRAALTKPAEKAPKGKGGSVQALVESVEHAELVQLREENGKLSGEIERVTVERDQWETTAQGTIEQVRTFLDDLHNLVEPARRAFGVPTVLIGAGPIYKPPITITTREEAEKHGMGDLFSLYEGKPVVHGTPVPTFKTRQEMEAAGLGEFWPYASDEAPPPKQVTVIPITREVSPLPPRPRGKGSELPEGERKVLTAIAQTSGGATREQLTVTTGYKRSSRDTYLQRLGAKGFVENRGGLLHATRAGIRALGSFEQLPTGDALLQHWLGKLPEGERKVLAFVARVRKGVTRDAISKATGYKRSSRDTYIQRLGARRLVTSTRDGVVASEELFG